MSQIKILETIQFKHTQKKEIRHQHPELFAELCKKRDKFAKYPREVLNETIRKLNPYEKLVMPKGKLVSRAGLKLAEILHKYPQFLGKDELYMDVAGGPGSFSQILFMRDPFCTISAITLKKEECELNLNWDYRVMLKENFHPYYGKSVTGNLYLEYINYANQLYKIDGRGALSAVADGGIDVDDGNENYQEQLNTRLFACEMAAAVRGLRIGGSFTCKLYETLTDAMIFLLYVMYLVFDEINIDKPLTSRPANSEKFLVAVGLKHKQLGILLLDKVIDAIAEHGTISKVQGVEYDADFMKFITNVNKQFLHNEIEETDKILIALKEGKCEDVHVDQDVITKLLETWGMM